MRLCAAPDCELEIAPAATEAIKRAAAQSADGRETGGIMFGYDLDANGRIRVLLATGPGPGAVRRSDYFSRDLGFAARVARLAHERYGLQWVGDWHTHPQGGAHPSAFDIANYTAQLQDEELDFSAFAAVIVTPHPVSGWVGPDLHRYLFVP